MWFFWSQVNTVSPSDVCVYIRYKANELVQARSRRLKVFSAAKFPHFYLSSYAHALKVHRKRDIYWWRRPVSE